MPSPEQRLPPSNVSVNTVSAGDERFDLVATSTDSLSVDPPIAIDCEIEEMIEWATHSTLIGRVRSVKIGDASAALVYWQGAYRPLKTENRLLSIC